jgi:Protein of unknown function (DUF4065)
VTFDKEKFKRLVHYIVWKAGNRDGFGATKLNKVLWFADARTYVLTGKPITGATYIREKFGPVPREFLSTRRELEDEGKIRVIEPRGEYEHTQFKSLGQPDTSFLTSEERQMVDYWLKHIDEDHTATSISEQTHDYPWEIAKMGEVIPLYACFATRVREPVGDELAWAKSVAERLKLP